MMASAGDADHQAVKQEDKKTDVGMREGERNEREEMKERRETPLTNDHKIVPQDSLSRKLIISFLPSFLVS